MSYGHTMGNALYILDSIRSESEARRGLTKLFDSESENLFARNSNYHVDKKSALKFIDAYSTAIEFEQKPNKNSSVEKIARQEKRRTA